MTRRLQARITARDQAIAAWIERVSLAEQPQIARRFELGRSQAYQRLAALRRFGLIKHRRIFAARPGCYTPAGRAPSPRSYEHTVALTGLVVEAELAGARTITEREARRAEALGLEVAPDLREASVPVFGGRHFPDLVIWEDGRGPIALELERHAKGPERLQEIVAGYLFAATYELVRYVCATAAVAGAVSRAVAELGAGDLIRVERIGA